MLFSHSNYFLKIGEEGKLFCLSFLYLANCSGVQGIGPVGGGKGHVFIFEFYKIAYAFHPRYVCLCGDTNLIGEPAHKHTWSVKASRDNPNGGEFF